jgi:hypothetical protein
MAGTRSDKSALEQAQASGDPDDVCEATYYLGMVRDSKEMLGRAASPECDFSDLAREALGQSR